MAHVLTLTDGTTTINLTSGTSCYVESYTPAPPDTYEQTSAVEYIKDGGELSLVTRRNVTETLEIVLVAASTTALQTLVGSIEQLLMQAERVQRWGAGATVYLTQKLDGESYTWRSEVLTGRLEFDAGILTVGWANLQAEARLHITRRHFWEYNASTIKLDMTSATTTTPGDAVTIFNDYPVGGGNWCQIASTATFGTLPAPLTIKATYEETAAIYGRDYYITANAFSSPTAFTASLYGSDTAVGATYAWATPRTHDGWLGGYVWELTSTRLAVMAGQWWRALAVITTSQAETFARINTGYVRGSPQYGVLTWSGEEVQLGSGEIFDLGAFPVPAVSSATKLSLIISLRDAGAGSAVLRQMQVTPAAGGFRHLFQAMGNLPDENDYFLDNGSTGETYMADVSADPDDILPIFTARGDPILVWPGVTQRFSVLFDATTTTVGHELTVEAWYRPRRLTM